MFCITYCYYVNVAGLLSLERIIEYATIPINVINENNNNEKLTIINTTLNVNGLMKNMSNETAKNIMLPIINGLLPQKQGYWSISNLLHLLH